MEWALDCIVFQAVVAHFLSVASDQSTGDSPELPAASVHQSISTPGSVQR